MNENGGRKGLMVCGTGMADMKDRKKGNGQ